MFAPNKANEVLEANQSIIRQRWPQVWHYIEQCHTLDSASLNYDGPQPTLLINGIHVSSCYNRVKEASLIAAQIDEVANNVWVYGIGIGDLPAILLMREKLKLLNIVLIDPGVLREAIKYFDYSDWMCDERVNLHMPKDNAEINVPYCVFPTSLKLADRSTLLLRDKLLTDINASFVSERFENQVIAQQINDNYEIVSQDNDVSELFWSAIGATVRVVAPGPSLSASMHSLKTNSITTKSSNEVLICVDAALRYLVKENIIPDIVVATDFHDSHIKTFLDVRDERLNASKLIYFPCVHQSALMCWKGARYTAYSYSNLYQAISDKYPKGILHAAGSVLHPSVDLAVKLGAARVELFGVDLCYPEGKAYANGAGVANRKEYSVQRHFTVENGHGDLVYSDPNFISYLRELEYYIQRHPHVEFVNMSREGAKIDGAVYQDEF